MVTDPPAPKVVTELTARALVGDGDAAARLFALLQKELRELAGRLMRGQPAGHTLQPTALVNEAYVRLAGPRAESWEGRMHFLATAARAMRQVLMDHAREKARDKRRPVGEQVPLDGVMIGTEENPVDLEALSLALGQLERIRPEMARAVDLRFFAGLDTAQTAEVLGLSQRTFERRWRETKEWLGSRMG